MRIFPLLLLASALGACGPATRPLPPRESLASNIQPEGKFHIAVIDVSESMDANDPKHYNEMGAHLAISLAGSLDNFGAVAFSSSARVLTPLRSLADRGGRRSLHDEVTRAPRLGQTNFVDALRYGRGMLAAAQAPSGASVIFLTDGRNNIGGLEKDVMAEVRAFRDQDWRIFTIGFTEEGESPLLQRMAVATRGAHFPVTKAEDLVNAFLTILGQVHNFMFFDGEPEPVHLLAGTDRLVYVVIKKSRDATISSLLRDGLAIDPKSRGYYKYPESVDLLSDLEIVSVENPPAGTWDIALQGNARVGAILQRPPFGVQIDPSLLQSEYYEGEKAQISILVEGGGGDLQKFIRERGRASAVLRPQGSTRDIAAADLKMESVSGDIVRYSGSAAIHLSRAVEQELQTLVIRFTLPEKGGGVWRREGRVSVICRSGPRPVPLRLLPGELDLGGRWADSGAATRELSLLATGSPVDVTARGAHPAIRVTPDRATVTASGVRLNVSVDPAALPNGPFESTVEIWAARGDGREPERIRVPLRMKVGRIEGKPSKEGFSFGDKIQGDKAEVTLPFPLEPGTEAKLGPLNGPGTIESKLDGRTLSVSVPFEAKEGEYAGKLEYRVPGMPLREFPVTLRVAELPATLTVEPAALVLEARKTGLVEKEIRLRLSFPVPVELKFEPENLKSKESSILASFVSLAPNEADWNGTLLPPGKDIRATIRVRVKSDLLNGDYAGKVILSIPGGSKPRARVELPLRVVVNP